LWDRPDSELFRNRLILSALRRLRRLFALACGLQRRYLARTGPGQIKLFGTVDSVSTQNAAKEENSPSKWTNFMGIVTTALGYFLITYAIASAIKVSFEKEGQQGHLPGNKNAT
jgi:hypothetical protein